jgi:uncharacterized protein
MQIHRVKGNDKIVAGRNKYAYQRGPLVYCAEWPDNAGKKVLNLVVPDSAPISAVFDSSVLNGMYVLKTQGQSMAKTNSSTTTATNVPVTLIPYFAWAHRGAGEMAVWIPNVPSAAQPLPAPTIAFSSKISASYNRLTLKALNDQMEPNNSNDHTILFYHWWPKKDTTQWVQYDFEKPEAISSSKVYWFDDGPFGGCRIPAGWKLLYKKNDEWVPVKIKGPYQIVKDQYSEVSFETIKTSALRLEVTLPKDHSSGIMEWTVND